MASKKYSKAAGRTQLLIDFILLPQIDREYLIRSTAERIGTIPPITIEKDFWVVYILQQLFTLDYANHLHFRGGTSLSKVYKVIDRFSEDIDLSIDRKYFDFDDEEISACQTVSQIDKLVKNLNIKNREFLQETVIYDLKNVLSNPLSRFDWSLDYEQDRKQYWLVFNYPQSLPNDIYNEGGYIKHNVKIEIYNDQDNDPWQQEQITPYISEYFPDAVTPVQGTIKVVSLGRTFFEKVALVHSHIERGKSSGDRFSRHLYDLHNIAKSDQFEEIVKDRFLLEKIIKHREIFYRQPPANYQKILNGKLNLLPQNELLGRIKIDYKKMDEMIYSQSPKFEDILKSLAKIQQRINE